MPRFARLTRCWDRKEGRSRHDHHLRWGRPTGEAAEAVQQAHEDGVQLHDGVGTLDGAPIPCDGGFKKDEAGNLVLTRLGEPVLQEVARIGQGAYVRSAAGSADIRAIYGDEIVGKLKRSEQLVRREKVWLERFQWPLGAAWFLSLLAFGVRGRAAGTVMMLFLLCSVPAAMRVKRPSQSSLRSRLLTPTIWTWQNGWVRPCLRRVGSMSQKRFFGLSRIGRKTLPQRRGQGTTRDSPHTRGDV